MIQLWNYVFICLYLNYDMDQDFSEQFEENTQALIKMMKLAEGEEKEEGKRLNLV